MVKVNSYSLFTRLYVGIVLAVATSSVLSFILINHYIEINEKQRFVHYTDLIYLDIKKQLNSKRVKNISSVKVSDAFSKDFRVSWKAIEENDELCEGCEFKGKVRDALVYFDSLDEPLVIYSFAEFGYILLVSENLSELDHDIELEYLGGLSLEDLAPFIFIGIMLLMITAPVYWLVYKLQQQIGRLIKTQHQFGEGNLRIRAHEDIEKPLNELAASFNTMAGAINDTVKENQIFAQAVPHEVRTPLSRIQLAVGLLRKNSDASQRVELLDNIDTYIEDIESLIQQVVAFSRLNSQSQNAEADKLDTINIQRFIDSRVTALAGERDVVIQQSVKEALRVSVNPIYFRFVIDNLVKNAIVHANKLVLISAEENERFIEIWVEEDGKGIKPDNYETIFYPFSRLDKSRSRKTGGLGLGLAIAKAASDKMNADLYLEKSSLGGAKFTLRHPKAS